MNKGKIVQVSGPVVDVEFSDGELPCVKDALEVDNHGKRCVMEVAQHIGDNTATHRWRVMHLFHRCLLCIYCHRQHKHRQQPALQSPHRSCSP